MRIIDSIENGKAMVRQRVYLGFEEVGVVCTLLYTFVRFEFSGNDWVRELGLAGI